jgi:hypothetical protein
MKEMLVTTKRASPASSPATFFKKAKDPRTKEFLAQIL